MIAVSVSLSALIYKLVSVESFYPPINEIVEISTNLTYPWADVNAAKKRSFSPRKKSRANVRYRKPRYRRTFSWVVAQTSRFRTCKTRAFQLNI